MKLLEQALNHPVWKAHKRNESVYFMDGKKDKWKIVYYPIFQDGKTQEYYDEPRALMQNIDKDGFWNKEVPLRYLSLMEKPQPPEPLMARTIKEGAGKICKTCGSSIHFIDYFFFQINKTGCINPKCKHYYERR